MTEITIHRHNPLIDPHVHIWAWQIPVYLFLGGLVAGLMILSGYHIIRAIWDQDRNHGHYIVAPLLSIVLLSLGMGALFLDLEHKLYVWRLYLTFQITSPMSWGSWILILVYPVLLASMFIELPEFFGGLVRRVPVLGQASAAIRSRPNLQLAIGAANIVLGVLLGIYTGILLSGFGAHPLWNTALLGPLFLFSGLSAGAAVLHVFDHFQHRPEGENDFTDILLSACIQWLRPRDEAADGSRKLTQADSSFLTIELFLLVLLLVGLATSTAAHQQAAALLLTGPYAASFWVFVVGCGLLLPLTLQLLQSGNKIRPTLAPALLVIAGSLVLRFIFVFAGEYSHWPVASSLN